VSAAFGSALATIAGSASITIHAMRRRYRPSLPRHWWSRPRDRSLILAVDHVHHLRGADERLDRGAVSSPAVIPGLMLARCYGAQRGRRQDRARAHAAARAPSWQRLWSPFLPACRPLLTPS